MQNRMVRGILSLCLGVLVFSLQDPLVKAVSSGYPVTEVMAIRSIVALPILIALVHADVGLRAILSSFPPGIQGWRPMPAPGRYWVAMGRRWMPSRQV